MLDVECPYCGQEIEMDCDDETSAGRHQKECPECGKTFVYTAEILITYDASKAPCLNGGEHNLVDIVRIPVEMGIGVKRCDYCDEDIVVDEAAMNAARKKYKEDLYKKFSDKVKEFDNG